MMKKMGIMIIQVLVSAKEMKKVAKFKERAKMSQFMNFQKAHSKQGLVSSSHHSFD